MNVKKLAIIGAIALVVIGCVLAAGCTTNTTTNTTTTATTTTTTTTPTVTPAGTTVVADGIVGSWEFDNEILLQMLKEMAIAFGAEESDLNLDELRAQLPSQTYVFNKDGTGKIILDGGEEMGTGESAFSWKSLGNNKFTINYDGQDVVIILSPEKGTLSDESGTIALKRLNK